MKKFSLLILSLTAFMLGLIWAVGSGEAVMKTEPETIYLADTVHINLDESPAEDESETQAQQTRETLFKEIKKFNQTVYDIKNRYMEEIDTEDLINAGIRGMLKNLDRFSVLMERSSYDRLIESTHGKYEGLGMEIDSRNDYITVVTPMEGTPAYNMGLRSGDQILEIDGQSTLKMTTADAAKLMRGPAGTKVTLSIMREGLASPVDFEIERAVIELKSVNYSGIIDGTNIGYLRLSRFAEETTHELTEAINELNADNIDALIFDLRSNGGGLLQQAVQTAELFVGDGRLIVFTRGRFAGTERRHYSQKAPIFPDKPMIILVDEGTASASEIVAGAIQDWDRGVILGHPTYGKGLVQQIFPIGPDGEVNLKLTTAKYYVPSGRCIQKPENQNKPGSDIDIAARETDTLMTDTMKISEKEVYYTNGGRAVYGGGGILPDIEIEEDRTLKPIEINLERKTMFFDFAVKYVANHPEATAGIEITDGIIREFKEFAKEKEFTYKTALEISLDEMKEVVDEEGKDSLYNPAIAAFDELVQREKEADFEKSIDYIKRAVKREIVSKIEGQRGVYEKVILKTDASILQAIELLKNPEEYSRVLNGGSTAGESALKN
ncbi:MAG: S41 family peptidase [Candidatus Zixiibacteriota bacterium]|nr:MAG: S41 family peptidase [candidate division Zixibacteria bacterium]